MRLPALDAMRGLLALAVCACHLRFSILVELSQTQHKNILNLIAYSALSLGRQYVMMFFVLSGFFVGGHVIDKFSSGDWNAKTYIIRRGCRLYVVLIPALLMTLALDSIGMWLSDGTAYLVASHHVVTTPDDSAFALLVSCAFLQEIAAPSFGTNAPLWSLANEGWYYLLFPLVLIRKWWALAAFFALCALLPAQLVQWGVIWLMGALIAYLLRFQSFRSFTTRGFWASCSLILLAAAMVRCVAADYKLVPHWALDYYFVGASFALLLPYFASLQKFAFSYLGEMSYTLYLTHFPFQIFVIAIWPKYYEPNLFGWAMFLLLLFVCLTWAYCIWWCFERNTAAITSQLSRFANSEQIRRLLHDPTDLVQRPAH